MILRILLSDEGLHTRPKLVALLNITISFVMFDGRKYENFL